MTSSDCHSLSAYGGFGIATIIKKPSLEERAFFYVNNLRFETERKGRLRFDRHAVLGRSLEFKLSGSFKRSLFAGSITKTF